LKHAKTAFIVTSRKGQYFISQNNNVEEILQLNQGLPFDTNETWTRFCCDKDTGHDHIDSVFKVAVEVHDIASSLEHIKTAGASILHDVKELNSSDGVVKSAVVKSCCGNVVHTIIEKKGYEGWFLPGFHYISEEASDAFQRSVKTTHFDHFTLACRVGETDGIIQWYERVFGMKRFVTNR
jgi:4-hydroxyphenylpyruvate dioxygenase-like putative hemolysin